MTDMTLAEAIALAEHASPMPHLAGQALRVLRDEIACIKAGADANVSHIGLVRPPWRTEFITCTCGATEKDACTCASASMAEPMQKGEANRTVADDVRDFGNGFSVDGMRIDPSRVVIYPAVHPRAVPAERDEMSPEFTDSARAAIAWVLYHHQGGSSPIGQPLRFALGLGSHERLPDWRIAEAKRWAERCGATTERFHRQPVEGVVDGPLTGKYAEVLAPFLAMMDRELHANSGKGDRPGWLSMDRKTALLEIFYHLAKLQKAAKNDDLAGVREFSADVANMSMMLADICGVLAATQEADRG